MSRFVRIVIWILFFIALYIAIGYFLPKLVKVETEIEIDAPSMTVYSKVVDLHSWNLWSKWNKIDPEMKVEFVNNGVGKGAAYFWESELRSLGRGSITILEEAVRDSVNLSIGFGDEGVARSVFKFREEGGKTNVLWSLEYSIERYPQLWWLGKSMARNIRKDFEEGLSSLKAYCELLEKEKEYIVFIDDLQGFNYAGIRERVPFIEIGLKMGEMYDEISRYLARSGAEMSGMPYSRYHLMEEEEIDLECGIPTDVLLDPSKNIITGTFPKTSCVCVDYYGDYQNLQEGHTAVQSWMSKRGFELSGPPMEIYQTDPGLEPDSSKWLTQICYPIE